MDLIRIFTEVQKELPVKLLLLGSGPGLETLHQMVVDLQLQDRVFFLGTSHDVDPYVASADLFLLPSAPEIFGLVALEAVEYGVPTLATRVGGLPEVIEDGVTGLLSPVGDVQKMARDCVHLLTHSELYQQFSAAGKKRAKEMFSVEKILPQYEAFYASILRL